MNKIYRVLSKENQEPPIVGYLISEDNTSFKVRVQNEIETSIQTFQKATFKLKSIYELGNEETYQVKTKDHNNQDITVNLSKFCFGGCG